MLSLVLVSAILAPSVLTLVQSGENKGIVIDFNEEEKKEEKKEVSENDFFLDAKVRLVTLLQRENTSFSGYYLETEYSTSLSVFLHPPQYKV